MAPTNCFSIIYGNLIFKFLVFLHVFTVHQNSILCHLRMKVLQREEFSFCIKIFVLLRERREGKAVFKSIYSIVVLCLDLTQSVYDGSATTTFVIVNCLRSFKALSFSYANWSLPRVPLYNGFQIRKNRLHSFTSRLFIFY